MQYIHSRGIVQCQLSPGKIVLAHERVCISDLSRSVDVQHGTEPLDRADTDPLVAHFYAYMSPEVRFRHQCND
jgi:hypothetical protein